MDEHRKRSAAAYAAGVMERYNEENSIAAILEEVDVISEPKRLRHTSGFFKNRPPAAANFFASETRLVLAPPVSPIVTIQYAARAFIARMRRRHHAAFKLQRALRQFVRRTAARHVIANLQAQGANPLRMTSEEWAERCAQTNVVQALQDMMRLMSRECCKRIGCSTQFGSVMAFADAFFIATYKFDGW
jgi:hypothetical protein